MTQAISDFHKHVENIKDLEERIAKRRELQELEKKAERLGVSVDELIKQKLLREKEEENRKLRIKLLFILATIALIVFFLLD
jgi:hypothetical protein